MHLSASHLAIWLITALAIAGVIIRPFNRPEAIWAVLGATLLLVTGLITPAEGWAGVAKGADVYLFLIGMMLLAETAREEGLFDWLAALATKRANGSPVRLFGLIYGVGIVVTTFLSNDATAVVLTPAVAAAVRTAKVDRPLPYLLICAFVANAASFVLPISNPANLVIYGTHMPPLLHWLALYSLPSLLSIGVTYGLLRRSQRDALTTPIDTISAVPNLSVGGQLALAGVGVTALVLLVASALDAALGLPTAVTGIITSGLVIWRVRKSPLTVIRTISWAVLPLVGGLFVLVEALNKTGLIQWLVTSLHQRVDQSVAATAWGSGLLVAVACNLMNNLPAGLIAGTVVQGNSIPDVVKSFVLIGVDLGPNLSVTGSLATILWLVVLRREAIRVSAWQFLKLGLLLMPAALFASLGGLWLYHWLIN